MKPRLVIILGPTAVGKSAAALDLAEELNGEIINADSQQVYRYMDIGTGKPSVTERARVANHVIDVVNPNEEFNAALFRRLASDAVADIHQRGKIAIVCGGTGLYLKALTRGLFEGPGQDAAIRRELENEIAEHGLVVLYRRLEEIDPRVGSSIHPNDRQRIIRALEVYRLTGKPLGEWQKAHAFGDSPFSLLKIGLHRDRAELYDLINRRSESMVRAGLLEEVRGLLAKGFALQLKPLQSVGYRQMGSVIREKIGLENALVEMQQETRRLAKRQLTWFRADGEIHWYHADSQKEQILRAAQEFLH
jgi:tRNA dimethylallyltransferase